MSQLYRVGEFAALTGVSVRTLHHYDAIGLLRPSAHSESGYRLYSERDLLALQQVLTLRYLGLPLKQIGKLLRQPEFSLLASLRIQRQALHDRIAELGRIEAALASLLDHRQSTGMWAWELVAHASAAVQDGLSQKGSTVEQMRQYYTPEQMKRWEELGKLVPEAERRQVEEEWTALLADVRANLHLDPASPQAQALADRWDRATATMMHSYRSRGFGDLLDAVGENYRKGSFANVEGAPRPADFAFIERVKAARKP
jgi:DNA-binding transcriptional MerR regulator